MKNTFGRETNFQKQTKKNHQAKLMFKEDIDSIKQEIKIEIKYVKKELLGLRQETTVKNKS